VRLSGLKRLPHFGGMYFFLPSKEAYDREETSSLIRDIKTALPYVTDTQTNLNTAALFALSILLISYFNRFIAGLEDRLTQLLERYMADNTLQECIHCKQAIVKDVALQEADMCIQAIKPILQLANDVGIFLKLSEDNLPIPGDQPPQPMQM
jgi:hypothetical protein